MWPGRFGGALIVGGCVFFAITGAILAGGGAVGIGGGAIGSLALSAAVALAGSGAAVLSVAGPKPLNGRALRISLGILAAGLISALTSSIIGSAVASDSPFLLLAIVLLILGVGATLFGMLATVLSLLRSRARRGSRDL
jgi:hypothetical protein